MAFQSSLHWRNLKGCLTLSFQSVSLYYHYRYTPYPLPHLDPTYEFSSPKTLPLGSKLQGSVEKALGSRFSAANKVIQRLLKSAEVKQWGRVRVTDPDTDDTIWAAALRPPSEDQREASYVRVSDLKIYLKQ